MTRFVKISALAGALLAAAAPAALAHHSAAMFDASKVDTVVGTVKEFNWTNPHTSVLLVVDAGGAVPAGVWTLEASSPGVMKRSGWDKHSFGPGDKITASFYPLRDGGLGGALRKVVLADGKVLVWNASNLPDQTPQATAAPWLKR